MSKTVESLLVKIVNKEKTKETCTCDICGRQIYKRSLVDSEEVPNNHFSVPFYDVTSGHADWGNDSGDSVEDYDICSPECLSILLDAYKNVSSKSDRNSWWIEIKHDYTFAFEGNGERPKAPRKYKGYFGYLMGQGNPDWKGFDKFD